MRVLQLTPVHVELPVLCQPKEGAVGSTFNEQSQDAFTQLCWHCRLLRLIGILSSWSCDSHSLKRLGRCCTGAENSMLFVVITVWHGEVSWCEWQRLYLSMEFTCLHFIIYEAAEIAEGIWESTYMYLKRSDWNRWNHLHCILLCNNVLLATYVYCL